MRPRYHGYPLRVSWWHVSFTCTVEGAPSDLSTFSGRLRHHSDYAQIGKEEVEIAVEFTKEVLKAIYQYSRLLKGLNSLKKPTS